MEDSRYLFEIIANDAKLLADYNEICDVDIQKLVGEAEILPDDTLPLYIAGFNGTEIAILRNVSRQLVSPKWKAQAEQEGWSVSQATEYHKGNRYDMQVVMGRAMVIEIEETKDLEAISEILSKEYQTARSKYRAFIALGGDKNTFDPSDFDKRLVDIKEDEEMRVAFEMFDEGSTNEEVSQTLHIAMVEVQRYKRNYLRRRNYLASIL